MIIKENLADLDELILRCRSDIAKDYISEAVLCYKAGAFRQCIVASWIAVVYDIVYKLQELKITEDRRAIEVINDFESIHQRSDLSSSLKFEREILEIAKEFEFITEQECTDLSRLKDDRNRCAHPSMNTLEEIYRPSAELARSHLRNAVVYLLQYPPSQGKAALMSLETSVKSNYFPKSSDEALRYFKNSPLAKARSSLVRNFLIILVKGFLSDTLNDADEIRYAAALNAVCNMYHDLTQETFKSKLNDIFQKLDDEHLSKSIRFLELILDTWQYLKDDSRSRINNYVVSLPSSELDPFLCLALEISELHDLACQRINEINDHRIIKKLMSYKNRTELTSRVIELFKIADLVNTAEDISLSILIPLINNFDNNQLEEIIKSAFRYFGPDEAMRLPSRIQLLRTIYDTSSISDEEFKSILSRNNIEENLIFSSRSNDIPF